MDVSRIYQKGSDPFDRDPPVLNLWDYSRRPKALFPVAGLPCRCGILTLWNIRPCPAALTPLIVIFGMAARQSQQHLQYQANTIKDRHVLSAIYLGLRVANDRRFEFSTSELKGVLSVLHETVKNHGEAW